MCVRRADRLLHSRRRARVARARVLPREVEEVVVVAEDVADHVLLGSHRDEERHDEVQRDARGARAGDGCRRLRRLEVQPP